LQIRHAVAELFTKALSNAVGRALPASNNQVGR
jgi:hypothetical protein